MLQVQAIIKDLQIHADKHIAAGMEAYQRNQFAFYGIRSPLRRDLSKPYIQLAKQEAQLLVKQGKENVIDWQGVYDLWACPYREAQYVATDYLKVMDKYLLSEDLERLSDLIRDKSWWDSVDSLVKRVGSLSIRFPYLKKEILAWSQSDDIWLIRTAIIHQLGLKEKTDLDILSQVIDYNINSSEFFVNKGIGWALREYAKTDQDWVRHFVLSRQDRLSDLSQREALKNIGR